MKMIYEHNDDDDKYGDGDGDVADFPAVCFIFDICHENFCLTIKTTNFGGFFFTLLVLYVHGKGENVRKG